MSGRLEVKRPAWVLPLGEIWPVREVDVLTTSKSPHPTGPRLPLRVQLCVGQRTAALDGAWWPQSRDLGLEFADLVDHFPVSLGRIVGCVVARPNWHSVPARIMTARGWVKVGSSQTDDTNVMLLRLSTRQELELLVVPATMDSYNAAHMMKAASMTDSSNAAIALLTGQDVSNAERARDEDAPWVDDGDSWWDPHPKPPSERG